jgi:hypothetical protein
MRNVAQFNYKERTPRLMPTVMHLEGNPGVGKSLIFSQMGEIFKEIFNTEDAFFCRSNNSKHWDGYRQQPVVGIDDFFSVNSMLLPPQESSSEFLQLASTVHYQPPMANLSDKGLSFNSPIILVSSNNINDQLSKKSSFTCPLAVSRRFDFNYRLFKEKNNYIRVVPIEFEYSTSSNGLITSSNSVERKDLSYLVKDVDLPYHFVDVIMKEYQKKVNFYNGIFRESITQEIQGSGGEFYYSFPQRSEDIDLVEAYAIPEPLKVRMITKGHVNTWCLKPLQLAMFKALKQFPIFEPCWDPDYDASRFHSPGELSVSGDYSAATDGLNQRLTRLVGSMLAKKYPELSDYILHGTGSHRVLYNKNLQDKVFNDLMIEETLTHSVVQTNGQLMGSLLSFPILCLVNAFSLGKVRNQKLTELDCLIHGDDITFKGKEEEIKDWKTFASSLGLEPSVGKNYQSTRWFTIDSKLFVDGKPYGNSLFKWLGNTSGIDQIPTLLERGMKKSTIVYFYKRLLDQSRRSMDVPVNFGGLGPKSPSHIFATSTSHVIYRGRVLRNYPRKRNGTIRMPKACLRVGDRVIDSKFEIDRPEREVYTPNSLVFEREAFASVRKVKDLRDRGEKVSLFESNISRPHDLEVFSDYVDIPFSEGRLKSARADFSYIYFNTSIPQRFDFDHSKEVRSYKFLKIQESAYVDLDLYGDKTIMEVVPSLNTRKCNSRCNFGVHHCFR